MATSYVRPNPAAGDDAPTRVYQRPPLPDGATWGRAADHHNGSYVYPGRAVLQLPAVTWVSEPETCPDTSNRGDWYGDVLVCPTCGLDQA